MIVEYHRPKDIDTALALLARPAPRTVPLGGGTFLNRPDDSEVAAVDLQALGLKEIRTSGSRLSIGACVTLQGLLQASGLPDGLQEVVVKETTVNLRQVATVAGTLVAADGRSPFTTAMLALDAELECRSAGSPSVQISLGDLLPFRQERLKGMLITQVTLPARLRLAYAAITRTPSDWPLVCAAVACWPSGRTRVALGGWGKAPLLALDGPEPGGVELAAREAYLNASDEWASAEYRSEMAAVLAARGLVALQK